MNKVIILSYHALPADVIASYRAKAYLRHLKKYGFDPTLVTHHWEEKSGQTRISYEEYDYGRVIRLPLKTNRWAELWSRVEMIPVLNKVFILARWCYGHLDPKPANDISSYLGFKSFMMNHLRDHHYDMVLGIFSPHHHLKLCYQINKRFGIPYILDFRDLWHNRVIHKKYQPNATEQIQDFITRYYWKKWLSKALFFSITSEAWRDKINEFSKTKGVVITNGFDPEDFEVAPKASKKFIIINAGKLYAHQRLDVFFKGCQLFTEKSLPEHFEIQLYGSAKSGLPNQLSGYLYEPKAFVAQYLSSDYYTFIDRIPKKELIARMKGCQILLFPGLPDSPGTHLGKIFDYLASGVNILMAPDDNDVVGDLIRETKTGQIANTPEEVCQQLTGWYAEWQNTGTIQWKGDLKAIHRYSRESQVEKLAATMTNQILNTT